MRCCVYRASAKRDWHYQKERFSKVRRNPPQSDQTEDGFLRTFQNACSLRLKPPSGHAGVAPLARSHRPMLVSPHIRICMFSASQAALRARRRGAFGAQSQAEVCSSVHSNMHVLCVSSRSQGTQAWRLWRAVTGRGVFLRTFEYACSLRLKPLSGHAGGQMQVSPYI